jgi:hypothetical protein
MQFVTKTNSLVVFWDKMPHNPLEIKQNSACHLLCSGYMLDTFNSVLILENKGNIFL